jgi:hypothetical protein
MNPIEESAEAERAWVPVPREAWSFRRLLPSLGFVALVATHEILGCAAAILWYHDRSFLPLQIAWYCVWETALLVHFVSNHVKIRGHLGPARLTLFWLIQAAWFTLGLWCFGVLFVAQPFAVEGVGAWLVGAYVLAAVAEDAGRPRTPPKGGDSYFMELLKHPMSQD